jgi:hypothetical protein
MAVFGQRSAAKPLLIPHLHAAEVPHPAGMIMGIHRTPGEWAGHPQGTGHCRYPALVEVIKVGDSASRASVGHPRARLRPHTHRHHSRQNET